MSVRPAIRILSTDAPKLGVRRCATAFTADTGETVKIDLAPAPVIKERMTSDYAEVDILVATLSVMEELARAGIADPPSISPIGSVPVGVVIRRDAPAPNLSFVGTFVAALLEADAIVYNRASSGLYVAQMLEKLGISDEIATKIVIVPNGAAVMQYLGTDAPVSAIGFGHVTEIRLHEDLGTRLAGPLPKAIGRNTVYAVGLHSAAPNPTVARALIEQMISLEGKRIFQATGVV